MSEGGGESTVVLDTPLDSWGHWSVWNGNLVFVQPNGDAGPSIRMLDLTTRQATELVPLGPGTTPSVGLDVSPDGRWILYTRQDRAGSDLMLVENFR